MTEEQEVPPESREGTSDTFASVWVKVEVCDDAEMEPEKMEIKPDIRVLQACVKQKKPPTVLKCDHCSYTSIYKNCFKMHILDHFNSKPCACDRCPYATKYPTSLQRHMFIKHQVVSDEYKTLLHCDKCEYKTYFKWNLKAHRRRHATNKQFQCEHCTYSTAYRHNFVKHSKVHNKMFKEYKCDKCPFVTKFMGHIQRHLSQIHNEVSDKACACDYCDFTTMVRWRLNVHKQRSRQENPIKCGRCDFQTHYSCENKKHKRTHSKEVLKLGGFSSIIEDKQVDANEFKDDADGAQGASKLETGNIAVNEDTEQSDNNQNTTKEILNPETNVNKAPIGMNQDIDKISKMFKPDMVNGNVYGVNDPMGYNYANDYNNVMKQGLLKAGMVNLYEYVQGVQDNDRQMFENDYNDAVRMSAGYLKTEGMTLYNMVNDVNAGQINTNVQIPTEVRTDLNNFADQPTTTKKEANPKLKKVKNYLVDFGKCETRKTIQVLESDDIERPFRCVKCTYTSKFKAAVVRHYQRLHTSEHRPFKCCNCDFATKTQDQISLHNKRSQAEGTLICNVCNFTTNFKCTYVMHQKVHYPHKCSICDYACRTKYDIQKHFTTIHLGEGMKCRYCDFKSARRESILCHEAIHTGHKPFKCDLCEYQSVRRSLLDVHFRRCHGHTKVVNGVPCDVNK